MRQAPGFTTGGNATLVRAGFTGVTTRVAMEGEALVLSDKGTRLAIPAEAVRRLRLAEYPATTRTRGYCEAMIERDGGNIVITVNRDNSAYGATLRTFAFAVAAARGPDAVLRGPGFGSAMVMLLLTMGSLSLLFAFLLWLALWAGGWWWAPVLILAPLYAYAWRAQIQRQWPRRVRDPAELAIVLPPFAGVAS